MTIKYSVAVATYNGEKYIAEQIQSILDQTLSVNEIIISDNGSTDHTIDIIKTLNPKNVIIKYFSFSDRRGPNGNIENAIKKCTGDYIFLADQDDIWLPEKVEKFNNFIISHPFAKCIASNGIVIGSNGKPLTVPFSMLDVIPLHYYHFNQEDYFNIIIKRPLIRGMALCCSKDFLNTTFPFPECYERHDHWILFCAICIDSFYAINERLVMYRLHDTNLIGMNKNDKKFVNSVKKKSSQVVFYHKNWDNIQNNNAYIINKSMLKKMRDLSMTDSQAYKIIQEQEKENYKQYVALHSHGVKGAVKLLTLYNSDKTFRNMNSRTVFMYKLLRILFSRNHN